MSKTIITAVLGFVVTAIAYFTGTDVSGDVPFQVGGSEVFTFLWSALLIVFARLGLDKVAEQLHGAPANIWWKTKTFWTSLIGIVLITLSYFTTIDIGFDVTDLKQYLTLLFEGVIAIFFRQGIASMGSRSK